MFSEYGFYIIKDDFFLRFQDPYLKGNHKENRPHYYAFKSKKTNLIWMVPVSSKIEKYKSIVSRRAEQGKPCDFIEVLTLANGKESAFVIGDMFPITEEYILRPYTICSIPFGIVNEAQRDLIHSKANKVLSMIRKGYKFSPTQPNVLKIEKELMLDSQTSCVADIGNMD